jgi:acyl-coenzyme A thioesterase 9
LSNSLTRSHCQLEAMKQKRQLLALRSLSRVPPSLTEAETLHSYYLSFSQDGDPATAGGGEKVWMGDTRLEKCMLMFPQERK